MALDPSLLQDLAAKLADARAGHMPVELEAVLHQRLDEDEAYRVQEALLAMEVARGSRVAGAKVGATNQAARDVLGCRRPLSGWLFESGRVENGGTLAISRLIRPRIECEVAVGLARDLRGPGVEVEDALAAAEWVAAAFEIIDCRVAGVMPTIYEIIADNSSSAAFVVSDRLLSPTALDLPGLSVTLYRNGQSLVSGSASSVMGDPAASVAWLANRVAELGTRGLDAGMIVLTGAMTPAQAVAPGDVFEADFGVLGRLSLDFTS